MCEYIYDLGNKGTILCNTTVYNPSIIIIIYIYIIQLMCVYPVCFTTEHTLLKFCYYKILITTTHTQLW